MNNPFSYFEKKMMEAQLPELTINNFEYYYNLLLRGDKGELPENTIDNVDTLCRYDGLDETYIQLGKSVKNKSIFIKLNGGLGTSMGLNEAKSLLKIKDNLTFLDIIAKQAENAKIELLLMNSFNTQEASLNHLKKYPNLNNRLPIDFLQNKIPKIDAETLLPGEYQQDESLEWCPPGHGEIYTALIISETLEKLLEAGIEYAFISNSDNLGAVMDYKILGYFVENNFPFLMEVALRTEADKKGGHLAQLKNGRFVLRESAQCPDADLNNFQDIERHKFFNTNNIWLNLRSLKKNMELRSNILGLPMIVNKKNIDPRDPSTRKVYQLETAMGSAISVFENATALEVPRSRFAPVKTTEDLLAVRSDNYHLTDDYRIIVNPKRKLKPLVISLDKRFYKIIDDLDERIPNPPSLVSCEKLTIKGNYYLCGNLNFKGEVIFENDGDQKITIK